MLVPFVASMGFVHHRLTCRSSSWETPSSVKVPKWAVIKTPFCFGSIGDNTTYTTKLCGDFHKLLQWYLINNQHNGKHKVFFVSHMANFFSTMRFPTCPSCLIGSVDRWLFCSFFFRRMCCLVLLVGNLLNLSPPHNWFRNSPKEIGQVSLPRYPEPWNACFINFHFCIQDVDDQIRSSKILSTGCFAWMSQEARIKG